MYVSLVIVLTGLLLPILNIIQDICMNFPTDIWSVLLAFLYTNSQQSIFLRYWPAPSAMTLIVIYPKGCSPFLVCIINLERILVILIIPSHLYPLLSLILSPLLLFVSIQYLYHMYIGDLMVLFYFGYRLDLPWVYYNGPMLFLYFWHFDSLFCILIFWVPTLVSG